MRALLASLAKRRGRDAGPDWIDALAATLPLDRREAQQTIKG